MPAELGGPGVQSPGLALPGRLSRGLGLSPERASWLGLGSPEASERSEARIFVGFLEALLGF